MSLETGGAQVVIRDGANGQDRLDPKAESPLRERFVRARAALLKVTRAHSLSTIGKGLAVLPQPLLGDIERLERDLDSLETGTPGPAAAAARHVLATGGKRVRPVICLLSARSISSTPASRELAALAQVAELIHTASLLHDDVIDLGEWRRGRPAARLVYGNAASVLGGNLLLVQALTLIESVGTPGLRARLLEVLRRMIDAEAIQLEQRGRSDISEDDYFQIVDGKTAVLFEWCAEAGARLAAAPEPQVLALAAYAYEVGVAFQLLDDVLDLSQEPGAVGKSVLQDVRSGTLTFPLVRALAQRPDLARRLGELRDRAPDGEALGQLVLSVVAKTGGLEAAREEIMRRTSRAHAALAPLPESRARTALLTLATELAARTE